MGIPALLALSGFLLPIQAGASSAVLKPFTTNGCTGFPDGTTRSPTLWRHCCVHHDLAFWAGGCRSFRDEADLELKRCVAGTDSRLTALIMYIGVRIGAHSPIKLKGERWNNGWQDGRSDRQPLSVADFQSISETLLSNLPADLSPAEASAFLSALQKQIRQPPACPETAEE